MKTTLLSLLLTVAFLLGCADTPISPTDLVSKSHQLIKLPFKSGLTVETTFSASEWIIGEKGGKIKIDEKYDAPDGHEVKIKGELKIPKHAFADTDTILITFTIDDLFAAASFTPAMVFDEPLELDLKFEGLDLESLNLTEGDYDFLFIDDDGNNEVVQYNGLHVNESKGKIWVNKAELNHFSRYGFTR
jgi:hypothetical protein